MLVVITVTVITLAEALMGLVGLQTQVAAAEEEITAAALGWGLQADRVL